MALYAIGDIQGCLYELQQLLDKINFNPDKDQLWLTGDLVNRGPDSLGVLRFLKQLPTEPIAVLGNHDLHLLALAHNVVQPNNKDTCQEVLTADDSADLIEWLRHRPLLHYDNKVNAVLVHAGIYPKWELQKEQAFAKEVERILKGEEIKTLLENMYGNSPECWSDTLEEWDRYRFIINAFTRMRYIKNSNGLELTAKNAPEQSKSTLTPWFSIPSKLDQSINVIFGHWASLLGQTNSEQFQGIDTGCVWGGALTALDIAKNKRISVKAIKQ